MKIPWLQVLFTLLLLNWSLCAAFSLAKQKRNKISKFKNDLQKLMDRNDNEKTLHLFFSRISRARTHTSIISIF